MNIVEIFLLSSVVLWIAVTGVVVACMKFWIELKAMQKSTHTIAYVDPFKDIKKDSDGFEQLDEELQKKLQATPYDDLQ